MLRNYNFERKHMLIIVDMFNENGVLHASSMIQSYRISPSVIHQLFY